MTKIYTKTGDKGETGTFRGRMGKAEALAEALGAVDELNSWVGLVRQQFTIYNLPFDYAQGEQFTKLEKDLRRIQGNLLTIGSMLAGAPHKFGAGETTHLERLIDKLEKDLPKIKNFIYPTGVGVAAQLQVARTVARRTERETVRFMNEDSRFKNRNKNILKYLNRLSDALFVMARWVNWRLGGKEEIWK